VKSSKNDENKSKTSGGKMVGDKNRADNNESMHNELYNVMITLMMQDCPFFILRSVCVFKFDVVSYLFLFFTFKNGILFSLQIYRIIAICTDNDYNYDPINDSDFVCNAVATIGNGMISGDLINESYERGGVSDSKPETDSNA